ncbi:MAG: hypothetical protein Q8R35_03550 [bacterium]|nr:hypothetical protein [bacterium]
MAIFRSTAYLIAVVLVAGCAAAGSQAIATVPPQTKSQVRILPPSILLPSKSERSIITLSPEEQREREMRMLERMLEPKRKEKCSCL